MRGILIVVLMLAGCPGPQPELPIMCKATCDEWIAFGYWCQTAGYWHCQPEWDCCTIQFVEETKEECYERMLELDCSNDECKTTYALGITGHGEGWCMLDGQGCLGMGAAGDGCDGDWLQDARTNQCVPANFTQGPPCGPSW